eukprot:403368096
MKTICSWNIKSLSMNQTQSENHRAKRENKDSRQKIQVISEEIQTGNYREVVIRKKIKFHQVDYQTKERASIQKVLKKRSSQDQEVNMTKSQNLKNQPKLNQLNPTYSNCINPMIQAAQVPPLSLNFFNEQVFQNMINTDRYLNQSSKLNINNLESTIVDQSQILKKQKNKSRDIQNKNRIGLKTQSNSVQQSQIKQTKNKNKLNTEQQFKKAKRNIGDQLSLYSSQQNIKFDIANINDKVIKKSRQNNNAQICEASKKVSVQSIVQQTNRNYSMVIAENILESPNERDFRDHKNNNIWGLKEIDVRDRPEHNFSSEEDPCNSCPNCIQLQKELMKHQHFASETQSTLKSNDLKQILSKIQFTKESHYYPEVICVQENFSDFEISLDDVAQERESIRVQLDFYNCNDDISERREKNRDRINLCRSKSELFRKINNKPNLFDKLKKKC